MLKIRFTLASLSFNIVMSWSFEYGGKFNRVGLHLGRACKRGRILSVKSSEFAMPKTERRKLTTLRNIIFYTNKKSRIYGTSDQSVSYDLSDLSNLSESVRPICEAVLGLPRPHRSASQSHVICQRVRSVRPICEAMREAV